MVTFGGKVMEELLTVDKDEWNKEMASVKEFYAGFGDKLPAELIAQLQALEKRMSGDGKPNLAD